MFTQAAGSQTLHYDSKLLGLPCISSTIAYKRCLPYNMYQPFANKAVSQFYVW